MDPSEEQASEIEALEAIFLSEYEAISKDPHVFRISFQSDSNTDDTWQLVLKFTLPPNYPVSEMPQLQIEEIQGPEFAESHTQSLRSMLEAMAAENLGAQMVYTLAAAAKTWIEDLFLEKMEARRAKAKSDEDERTRKQEEEETKKRIGTPVTRENFLAWRAKFDREMQELSQRESAKAAAANPKKGTKKNGRQLFEEDASLFTSENLDEGDVIVDVDMNDESLFNLEDLPSDDEEGLALQYSDDDDA